MDDLFESLKMWNMFGTVDVGFHHMNDDPPLGLSSARDGHLASHGFRQVGPTLKVFILDDCGLAVDMQTYRGVKEVAKSHANVRILRNVTEAGHHAVAPIFGKRQPLFIQSVYEPRQATAKGAIALAP